MDDIEGKIAIATSDGIVVNNHFGRAKQFYIYEINNEVLNLLEVRDVTPVCDCGNHDEDKLRENIKAIEDCKYLLVSKIGDGALAEVESFGIEAYEIPGIISESVKQLTTYIKLKELFK